MDHLAQGMLKIAAIEGQLGFVKFLGQIALLRLFVHKIGDRQVLDCKYMLGLIQIDLLHTEIAQLFLIAKHRNTGTEGLIRPQARIAQCKVLAGKASPESGLAFIIAP